MSLDERKRKILEAIVLDYTSTAEPVGSRTISKKYGLSISPATVRNEMADLEDMGYIEQPHTSAGRMPSDQGYRYYVDYIMQKNKLDEAIEKLVISSFKGKINRFDDAIKISMELIAKITRYPSLFLVPEAECSALSMIRILKVDATKALLIIITENNLVENIFVDLPEGFEESDLNLITNVINSKLSGTKISGWSKTLIRELYGDLLKQKDVLTAILDSIEDSLNQKKDQRVYSAGFLQMLNEPEFRDIDKIKGILSFFDDKKIIEDMLLKKSQVEDFQVLIGMENEADEIKDCSLIKKKYNFQGDFQGIMGIVGPKRMDYSNSISLLELISEVLEKKK